MEISPQAEKLYFTVLQSLYAKHFGQGYDEFTRLSSHGSDRFIARLRSETAGCIGIVNANTQENRTFIKFAETFRDNGLKVPKILAVAKGEGSYLLEDLGDETLAQRVNSDWTNGAEEKQLLYKRVIETLPRFQVTMAPHIDYRFCYQFDEFAEENIDFDLNYFRDRFLKVFYKGTVDENQLNTDFNLLKNKILELPRNYFLYRDFQSRNIMIKDDELYYIDFQSGRHGALLYDIASLLYDAKANIPQELREVLLSYYLDTLSGYTNFDRPKYENYFWHFAVMRILQAMGAYGYVGIVKGRPKFLESIPYALKNVNFILSGRINQNELNYLQNIFAELENAQP